MTIEAEEETKLEEETNAESETVATTIVQGRNADVEDKDAPISHSNISTRMVAAHTSVLNVSPKYLVTKTPPPLKTCREAAP